MKHFGRMMLLEASAFIAVLAWGVLVPSAARAHCDTLNGPVVSTARAALEKGDVNPVLRWVRKEDEDEVRAAFKRAVAVRDKGAEARELADLYFFETLVRIHRAGEGEPFTGLKSGAADPVVEAADGAIERGSVDGLVRHVTEAATAGIRERFTHVMEAKKHANESVEAGRAYVRAYVEYVHYVAGIHGVVAGGGAHAEGGEGAEGHSGHGH